MCDTKTCNRCQKTKPVDAFGLRRDNRRGTVAVNSECRQCASERAAAWQKANPERASASQARWRRDKRHAWLRSVTTATRKRLDAQRAQTPPWADIVLIADVYELAASLRADGLDVVVDHIVPLQGKTASGLHVHQNLQIIERRDNSRKRNTVPADPYAIPHALDLYGGLA